MALPLAAIGLGGALALVVLQGEQPGEGAEVEAVPGMSRPTLVSAHRSSVAEPSVTESVTAPPPPSSVEEIAPVEVEVREAVRSGPSSVTEVPVVLAAPDESESTVEERRQRGERSHRHRPTRTAPPVTTAPDSVPPPTITPATTTPDPTVEPVPPAPEVMPTG